MSQLDRSSDKEYTCPMCHEPVDLNNDGTADEDGQVMHAECYFKRIGGHGHPPPDDHHTQ
jgi:hypothetical protein